MQIPKHFIKKGLKGYTLKKKAISRFFKKLPKTKTIFHVKRRYLYFKIKPQKGIKTWFVFNFHLYSSINKVFNSTLKNRHYLNVWDSVGYKNYLVRTAYRNFFDQYELKRLQLLHYFMYSYNILFFSIYTDIFYFIKKSHLERKQTFYYVILTFRNSKLFINLLDSKKKNYVSIASGLFIKFFEKKKSLKNGKNVKMLMAKYLRKLLLISKVFNLILVIKRVPLFLPEIVNLISQPIAHKFFDPLEKQLIDESEKGSKLIKFLYFIFLNNKTYVKSKTRLSGRVKRKIKRKIVFGNKIVD